MNPLDVNFNEFPIKFIKIYDNLFSSFIIKLFLKIFLTIIFVFSFQHLSLKFEQYLLFILEYQIFNSL